METDPAKRKQKRNHYVNEVERLTVNYLADKAAKLSNYIGVHNQVLGIKLIMDSKLRILSQRKLSPMTPACVHYFMISSATRLKTLSS